MAYSTHNVVFQQRLWTTSRMEKQSKWVQCMNEILTKMPETSWAPLNNFKHEAQASDLPSSIAELLPKILVFFATVDQIIIDNLNDRLDELQIVHSEQDIDQDALNIISVCWTQQKQEEQVHALTYGDALVAL